MQGTTFFGILGSTGELQVRGEVRTVDSTGQPRLWGSGRPGGTLYSLVGGYCDYQGISYGLTEAVSDWASAADVCPAGSWLCTKEEIRGDGACRTGRGFDWANGYLGCDGIIRCRDGDDHIGWLADSSNPVYPSNLSESGDVGNSIESCNGMPVWCCFE